MHEDTKVIEFDSLSKEVVDCAYQIHKKIGSGLLEGIYEDCFVVELKKRNIEFERQKIIKIKYDGVEIPTSYKLDLLVDNKIILELKSIAKILPVHQAQILTYMKTSNINVGLLINFGDPYFKTATKRFVL